MPNRSKMSTFQLFILLAININYVPGNLYFFKKDWDPYDQKYGHFPASERRTMREEVRRMFTFAYDNYMEHAFPQDELDPIHCDGRGPDYDNPSNININDVLGDYSLTLVDSLDTLAIMGNASEFKRAVKLVLENVSFETSNTVQVFEVTIRIMGALISAHLLMLDPQRPFGAIRPDDYDGELLHLAHDLGARLLPAFENTVTGIPYPRVNLMHGVPKDCLNETCTSGAGTLVLEFSLLSHLLQDPVYESVARRALEGLWKYRSNVTGLLGNVINIQSGEWVGKMSGLGAGLDSLFEYLLKVFILFGDQSDLKKFNEAYETIKFYMRRGRKHCNKGNGYHPIYVNVNMKDGELANNWIDALQASWAGVQVLNGDVEEAICSHALYYSIWLKYGVLPERYNWHLKSPDVLFYPLRPEFVESTYLLYRATKNPFYLHVGKDIVDSLNRYTKVKCGYATVHNVLKKEELEDRMESFFLSETCKYLYLLFDEDNHVNKEATRYVFTTEGHVIPIDKRFREKPWQERNQDKGDKHPKDSSVESDLPVIVDAGYNNETNCHKIPEERTYFLPVKSRYLYQLEEMVGLH